MATMALTSPDVLVFDGECGFCTWSADRLRRWAGGGLAVVPWQRTDLSSLGLTQAQCAAAVQFVGSDGRAAGGAAIARALLRCPQPWRSAGLVLSRPWLTPAVERGYSLFAAHRHRLPGGTPACSLHDDARGSLGVGG